MKTKLFSLLALVLFSVPAAAQSTVYDIPTSDLPSEVKVVLDRYVEILNSETLDQAAEQFIEIAGGSLVNPTGTALRRSIPEFSLRKDYLDIQHYKQPVVITRVSKTRSNGSGYGDSAIAGDVYKIWIAKKDGVAGVPAPVSILVPENHEFITEPKVVNIGSF